MFSKTAYTITVNPKIPPRLERLEELANNLWYGWDRATRSLFSRLDHTLWGAVGHNPKAFLKRADEIVLQKAAEDPTFLTTYDSVLATFDSYLYEPSSRDKAYGLQPKDQIVYFCFEFGFQ